jgi:hypothetical protein
MDTRHDTLDAAIQDRIARYTPSTLASSTWDRLGDQIRHQVKQARPGDVEDAKSLLVTLCQYVAWRERQQLPTDNIAATLDEAAIAAYAAARATTASRKTVENQLGRLRRLHRRQHQLPDPDPSTSASTTTRSAPYSPDELTALRAAGNPHLTETLDLAITTGTVIPTAYTHPHGYDRATWHHARHAARDIGITLNSSRLHATWAHTHAQLDRPAIELLRSGLTTADLDAIAKAGIIPTTDRLALAR